MSQNNFNYGGDNFNPTDTSYTNFNQFLDQYQCNPTSQPYGNVYQSNSEASNIALPTPNPMNYQFANSTLVPTAAEFVPRWYEAPQTENSIIKPPQSFENIQGDFTINYNESSVNFQPNISNVYLEEANNQNIYRDQGAVRKPYNQNRNTYKYSNYRGEGNGERYSNYDRPQRYESQDYRYDSNRSGNSNYNHRYNNRNNDNRNSFDNSNSNSNNRQTNSYSGNDRNNGYNSYKKDTKPVNRVKDNIKISNSPDERNSLLTQRDKLANEIDAGKLECLVCCENIKPFQPIWSCFNCYHILHLNCTIKWATSSKTDDGGWRCPACQNISKRIPRDYLCFCGKTKNPQYNRNDLAHTCGELCEKKENCDHPCTSLCHPGPCPSCQATVTRYCGCGKTSRMMQCTQKDDIKCSEICSKMLNCDIHKCEKKCHFGDCKKCEEKVTHNCHCGKNHREVPCNKSNKEHVKYSCGKICNKSLSCNNHRCTKPCHAGDCGECKLSPHLITSCPCGKLRVIEEQRKNCLEPIPLCSSVCKKPLKCGPTNAPHLCTARCHNGNCPPCNKETAVRCRCGHMDQMIKCRELSSRADDARCKKRCTKKRNCGKHKCNQECCIDIDHICPMPCTYSLSCGKHKCDQPCHKGRCLPCYRSSFEELYCECGVNVLYPPVPCGTKRPACDQPCTRQHPCNHPVQHNCHSASTCPACMILTTKSCHGKHEQRKTIPCSQDDFSCGMPCNKPLECKRHNCIKICHPGACMIEGEICKQNCTKVRDNCSHKCNAPCHDGECPDTPCREMVEVICQCGNRKQSRSCHDFVSDYRRIASANFASSMQEMQRGHAIELSDILGPIKTNNNKTLECNEECKVLERNRRLVIGLQIVNPDLGSKLQPKYSDFLKGWAKKDPILLKNIHDKLTQLVKLAKESKQKSRSHSFPTMNREKRRIVHEMCAMFGVESVAYDAEPNRNVVATAYREKTWLPSMSISEVLQREGGQRRIPVPANAWGLKK